MDFETGEVLYFDKPLGWTSFDVVSKVRRLLCRKLQTKRMKVGHAGTLDPLATGLLVVCTGKATKRINELMATTKEYVATLQLGATTPSFDLETETDHTYPTDHITEERVQEVLTRFTGKLQQVPPTFSACKVDGHRAYKLARKGEEVELKPKTIVIEEMEKLNYSEEKKQLTLRIVCSKGTYIRALARDIGQALDSGAHLIALRRTRVGDVGMEQCMTIEDFEKQLEQLL